jgi:hypothetical protein
VSRRHDEDLVQITMRQPTVEREVHELRAARRVVSLGVSAGRDCPDDDG